jgi:protein SCO1/2
MTSKTLRSVVTVMGLALMTAVVSAQDGARGVAPSSGLPANQVPAPLNQVTFEQRLNEQLPLDLPFKDESGKAVKLGDYFGRKPVILTFVYYECPMLCTQVLNGLESALRVLNESVGDEFDVVTVSFDPRETPLLAAGKKNAYLDRYKREGAERGWHFLTGEQASIDVLTKAAGFSYTWDEATQQFAHVSGVLTATPDGRLSRYFYGVEFSPRDLRLALVESSAGKIGSLAEELLLYCYQYDPTSGRYGPVVMNLVRLGGVVTVGLVAAFVIVMRRRESRSVERRA